jgi:hypothetical protein
VFGLLEEIRKRPELFLGVTSEDRGAQLRNLDMLLRGYGHAISQHGIKDPGRDFLQSFDHYLQTCHGWTAYSGIGAIPAIQKNANTGDEAWELFWRLVDEFKSASAR